MRSKIEPIKKVAKMIRRHGGLILNWFRAKGEISNGVVEGMNGKEKCAQTGPMVFEPFEAFKLRCTMHLATYPLQSSPTDSGDEAIF